MQFVEDVAMILRSIDRIQKAGCGVENGIIKTASFAGDNPLDGAKHRSVKRLHVAGGINLAYDAVKGKDVIVRKGFQGQTFYLPQRTRRIKGNC